MDMIEKARNLIAAVKRSSTKRQANLQTVSDLYTTILTAEQGGPFVA